MKIIDILKQDKMSLSFEVFPPKKETSFENVKAATESIAALGPAFMSVTYGAGGGVSHFTLDIAKNLKEKVDAGADFLTTQMVFDNNLFFSFLYKLRDAGVNCPVLPGIMPITNANQVERAIKLSGSFMPQRFKSLVDKFGSDPEAMKQAGIIYASDQIIDLYANGITNVHVYSMNKPDVAEGILKNVSAILGKSF